MFQFYIFVKKSRTTLSQIQLFNTSRCKSVILEYTFYLSIAEICTVLSYRIVEIFDVFTLNVPFIRFESNRSLESLKTQFILLDSICENENSDTSDVSSTRKSRYSRTYFNPTRLFIWKFFFPFGRFPRGCLELPGKRRKNRSRSISKRSPIESKLTRTRS